LKARYLPALSGAIETTGFERRCKYTGKPLTFWQPESLVHYPYMLMSAWYGLKVGLGSEWRDSRDTKDVFVLGDSGGFQAVTQGEKLDSEKFNARKVIDWQNENVNVGLILDVPPFKAQIREQKGIAKESNLAVDNRTKAQIAAFGIEADFELCMNKTAENAKIMRNRQEKCLLYGVIQGTTQSKMEAWHKAVSKAGDFEGWALAPKPNDDYDLIYLMMKYAYNKLQTPLHFLQLGGPRASVMIERFSKVYDHNMTYDNSTPFKLGGVFRIFQTARDGQNISIGRQTLFKVGRKLLDPGTNEHRFVNDSVTETRRTDPLAAASWRWIDGDKPFATFGNEQLVFPPHMDKITRKIINDCECEVCQAVTVDDYQANDVEGALYLILHDLHAYAEEQKRSKAMAFKDDEILTQFGHEFLSRLQSIDDGFPDTRGQRKWKTQ